MVRVTPWEAIVVAADVAVKAAHVEVGFMDRFCGTLILTGGFYGSDDSCGRSGAFFP